MTATSLVFRGVGYARANGGRWIVDCAAPYCGAALTLGPSIFDAEGRMIRVGLAWNQEFMCCWECDFVTAPIIWPPDPLAIVTLLMFRPDWRTRNWEPGETLEDLLADNVAHGLMPEIKGLVMRTEDHRVVDGLMIDYIPGRRALLGREE